jgi:hypothetical protein
VKCDCYCHILRFMCFGNDMNQLDENDSNYDRLCKIRTLFDQLSNAYGTFHSPAECLAPDDVIVLFKGWVIVKQYISNKT